jgi:peroxiredoxin
MPASFNRRPYKCCTKPFVAVLSVLITLFASLIISEASESQSPFAGDKLINKTAPDFSLKDLKGKTVSLASYRGSVVLLCFWATWCPPCREEMPSLNNLSRQMKNRKFAVIAVSLDRSEEDSRDFFKKYPVDFPALADTKLAVSKSIYKVFMLPTTFLINKKGIIVEKFQGEEDWTEPGIVKRIEELIKE